jgi:hypothetical protein
MERKERERETIGFHTNFLKKKLELRFAHDT